MRSSLKAAIRLAGAKLVEEDGRLVALDYGSVGGELAACRQAAGIAVRLAAVVLELRGSEDALSWLFAGQPIRTGQAFTSAHTWVVPLARERVLLVADPRRDRAEIARVQAATATSSLTCDDDSAGHDVLVLVGPHAAAILDAPELEREGDLPALTEVADIVLAGSPTSVLRAEPERFVLLTDPAHSVAIWHALNDAGRPWGIASVGREALELLEIGVHSVSQR